MSNDFFSFFSGGSKSRELSDTLELYRDVERNLPASPFNKVEKVRDYVYDLVIEACEREHSLPTDSLLKALYSAVWDIIAYEGYWTTLPEWKVVENLSLEEGVAFREELRRNKRFLADHKRMLSIWRSNTLEVLVGLLKYFPLSAFQESEDSEQSKAINFPEAFAYDLIDRLDEFVEGCLDTVFASDVIAAGLFVQVRTNMEHNLLAVSGIPRPVLGDVSRKILWPTKNKEADAAALVNEYLSNTPFQEIASAKIPFAIPFPARFEHTHIVAGSGHGKTQLLQFLIHHDLVKALDDGRSVVVMDSQGDMIRTISHLKLFDSCEDRNLADRFVLVDPTDVEHPIGLNMFDFDRARVGSLSTKDREMILNATVETYEYFFGALLGAELTQRQGVIFRYIARLMMEIPDATIHTLLGLMLNGGMYRPYMEKLSGTARTFFLTQFFDRQFSENKKQITARLYGVLSNPTLERMFSHPKNKLDLFRLTQEGKIILINTAKDFLGHEGSSIFGRFVVSLIAQAAIQRAILPSYERTPTFAYIDEAEDYFDENIDRLVNQARKFKIGLVFSHQNLDQLTPALRASVLASTSIKFAGGLSSKDANTLDSEFRTTANFLLAQKKHPTYTQFACYVKNFSPKALSIQIPLGYVENQPTLDEYEYETLLERNREEYSVSPVVPDIDLDIPKPKKPERSSPEKKEAPSRASAPVEPEQPKQAEVPIPEEVSDLEENASVEHVLRASAPIPRYMPKEQGGGGKQHRYLAHLVKQYAEDRGFKASIEQQILGGAGYVDVELSRDTRKIAVEISVTTGRDHELGNVEKCLSAGYEEVLIVSTNPRHLTSLARFIPSNLEEKDRDKVRYFSPEGFIEYLGEGGTIPASSTEKIVRGYKVKTTVQAITEEEAEAKRSAIAEIIARSIQKGRGQ